MLDNDLFKIAYNKTAMLKIYQDDDEIETPRDWDNIGTMVCWHNRYILGDKHNFDTPEEFLRNLVYEITSDKLQKNVVYRTKAGEFSDNIKLAYDKNNKEWELNIYSDILSKWFVVYTFESKLNNNIDEMFDYIIENMDIENLFAIIKDHVVILPLYLYDHSGITMSVSGFSCPFDSGQVGYIYATKERFIEETGYTEKELFNNNKAEQLLKNEVKVYDDYLIGDIFGFNLLIFDTELVEEHLEENNLDFEDLEIEDLEEFIKEEDSCWGFYGRDFENNGVIEAVGEFGYLVKELDYI